MRGLLWFGHPDQENSATYNGASAEEVIMIWPVNPDMFIGRDDTVTATIEGTVDATSSLVFKLYFGSTWESWGSAPTGTLAATFPEITAAGTFSKSTTLTKPTGGLQYMKLTIKSTGGGTTRSLGVTFT